MEGINIRDKETYYDLEGGKIVPSGDEIEFGDQGIRNEEGLFQYG